MIACSADEMENETMQARLNEVGFDSYLMAPLTTSKVQETVIKLIKQRDIDIYNKIKIFKKPMIKKKSKPIKLSNSKIHDIEEELNLRSNLLNLS